MKFRAVFTDPSKPTPERPDQVTSQVFATIKDWALIKFKTGGEGSYVRVFETVESEIYIWNSAEKVKTL